MDEYLVEYTLKRNDMKQHHYKTNIVWTGNKGEGTSNYRAFDRSYTCSVDNKPDIFGSADAAFLGDKNKYNPEELLVASLSSCHMLWYLHLCSEAGIIVLDYTDIAKGTMIETANGGGRFSEVTLYPVVTVTENGMIAKANALHIKANELCFIANSISFDVLHQASCVKM